MYDKVPQACFAVVPLAGCRFFFGLFISRFMSLTCLAPLYNIYHTRAGKARRIKKQHV